MKNHRFFKRTFFKKLFQYNVRSQENLKGGSITVYPSSDYSSSRRKLKVKIHLDFHKLFLKYSDRPSLFQNLEPEQQKSIISRIRDFSLILYRQDAIPPRSPDEALSRVLSGTLRKIGEKRVLNPSQRTISKGSAIYDFEFEDTLSPSAEFSAFVYSYELKYEDPLNMMISSMYYSLKEKLRNIRKYLRMFEIPSYGIIENPDLDLGLGSAYTNRYKKDFFYSGIVNSFDGTYTHDFSSSALAEKFNMSVTSLLEEYLRCLEFVYGKEKIYNSSLGISSENYDFLRSSLKEEILGSIIVLSKRNHPIIAEKFILECERVLTSMRKLVRESRIDGNFIATFRTSTPVDVKQPFLRDPLIIESGQIMAPCTLLGSESETGRKVAGLTKRFDLISGAPLNQVSAAVPTRGDY